MTNQGWFRSRLVGALTDLTSLNLSRNPLGNEGAKKLAQILEQSSRLVDLKLSETQLGNKGIAVISKALSKAYTTITPVGIHSLDLSHNAFNDCGPIACIFTRICRAKYVNLGHNKLADSGIVGLLKSMASMRKGSGGCLVEHLDLTQCKLGSKSGAVLAKLLKQNELRVRRLTLVGNHFGNDFGTKFAHALRLNTMLQAVDINQLDLGRQGWIMVRCSSCCITMESF